MRAYEHDRYAFEHSTFRDAPNRFHYRRPHQRLRVIHGDLLGAALDAVVLLALTLLVSRRRKNWARWALLVLFLLGVAFMAWNAPKLFVFGYPAVVVALVVTLMNALAVVLLFTPESSNWLRTAPSPA